MDGQGDQPAAETENLPRVFVTDETLAREKEALRGVEENSKDGVRCKLCPFIATCLNRLHIHTRQHLINQVCGCGEMSHRRDSILKHIAKERSGKHFGEKGCRDKLVFEVDEASFQDFRNQTRNPALEFLPLKPCTETVVVKNEIPKQKEETETHEEARASNETETSSQIEVKPLQTTSICGTHREGRVYRNIPRQHRTT